MIVISLLFSEGVVSAVSHGSYIPYTLVQTIWCHECAHFYSMMAFKLDSALSLFDIHFTYELIIIGTRQLWQKNGISN